MALSSGTRKRIDLLFSKQHCNEVARLLDEECSPVRLHLVDANPRQLERFHFAVLKLSEGSIEKLYDAVALAQTDYRDLLMAAGFGHSTTVHEDWLKS